MLRASCPAVLLVAAACAGGAASTASAGAADLPDRVCADEFIFTGEFRNVTVPPGTWCLIGEAKISGNFTATDASSVGIFFDTTVAGDVLITGTTSFPDATGETFGGSANAICTTTIKGNLTITGSAPAASWNLGSTNYPPYANFSNCVATNTVGGTLRFDDNAGSVNAVGGNAIGGDLTCSRNGPFTPGVLTPTTPNAVQGRSRDQCAALGSNPEPTATPVEPTTTPAPPATQPCRSRRRFTIRLDRRLTAATVVVRARGTRGRRVRVLDGRRLRAVVDLRGLSHRRVDVVISGRTGAGRRLRSVRTYRPCGRR